MVETPEVSVVVPNYNHARYLPKRIDSILQQTYDDFELILLDDCSTDESRSILSEYARDPRVRVEFNEVNSGSPFKQWNKGVRLTRGKYVWIAESDDYADPRLLERLVTILTGDPSITLAYCGSLRVTELGGVAGLVLPSLEEPDLARWSNDFCADGKDECRKYLLNANTVVNASAVVFRKDTYEAVGGPDESLRLCGDWKLWAAMALRGKVAYVSEPLNYFRFHDTSVRTKSIEEAADFRESLMVVRWILDELNLPQPEREQLFRKLANSWVASIMSFRISLKAKKAILQEVQKIDPQPLRRIVAPALATVQRKVSRHWRDFGALLTHQDTGKTR